MQHAITDPRRAALVIIDLTNDFLHPDGAYARGGQGNADIAALPARVLPVAQALRAKGGSVVSAEFTLVPGRDGEPLISPHLKAMRPFLGKGDFAPGSWGQTLVDELQPADFRVEKVAYSAFYMTRLEWVLRKEGIDTLLVCGIVTNGGVASTVRDAHMRDFATTVLTDGCAAFSKKTHETTLADLTTVAGAMDCDEAVKLIAGL
jgi:nicotinamidase-related amidase